MAMLSRMVIVTNALWAARSPLYIFSSHVNYANKTPSCASFGIELYGYLPAQSLKIYYPNFLEINIICFWLNFN